VPDGDASRADTAASAQPGGAASSASVSDGPNTGDPDRARSSAASVEMVVEDGVRTVIRRYTIDGKPHEERHQLPDALTHFYAPGLPGEPVPLYEGDYTFRDDSAQRQWTGHVTLTWYPTPTVVATGASPADWRQMLGEHSVSTSKWVVAPYIDLPTAPPPLPGPPSGPLEPLVREPRSERKAKRLNNQQIGNPDSLDRVTFLIPNGWTVWGGSNVCDPEEPEVYWRGRIQVQAGDWLVTLDRRREADQQFIDRLSNTGASAVTHVGEVKRVDGARFHVDEITGVLSGLRAALSLALGRAVDVLLPVGWQKNAATWALWGSPRIDSVRDCGVFLDKHKGHAQLAELIERMITYGTTDDRLDVMRYATSYYITATYDTDVELRVALPVSGLQLLSYNRFVEEKKTHSKSQWKALPTTEDEIRLLLDDCEIPTALPQVFTELQAVSTAAGPPKKGAPLRDALGCVMLMRNKIIHPTKGTPSKWDPYQWWEAGAYATQVLLLAILHTIGYQGQYRCAWADVVDTGVTDPVPWASKS